MEWIFIHDEKPKINESVIVFADIFTKECDAQICEIARLNSNGEWDFDDPVDRKTFMVEVTHWMPLPNPPSYPF